LLRAMGVRLVSPPRKIERRTLHRAVRRIAATFESGKIRGQGYVKNVSKTGLFLRANALPDAGSEVRVFLSDRAGKKVTLRGTVRWTTKQLPAGSKAQPGFGVQIPPDDPAFIEFFEQILFT
jgi:PilZ domain-containing protein